MSFSSDKLFRKTILAGSVKCSTFTKCKVLAIVSLIKTYRIISYHTRIGSRVTNHPKTSEQKLFHQKSRKKAKKRKLNKKAKDRRPETENIKNKKKEAFVVRLITDSNVAESTRALLTCLRVSAWSMWLGIAVARYRM